MKPGNRKPSRFTQRDVTRAIKAGQAAGREVEIVIMPDNRMRIIPMSPQQQPNEADAILAKLK
jgi:hypothetical protein